MWLKWMLIVAISMVSLTMLMFVSAFLPFLEQAKTYYHVTKRNDIILLSNSFNICYLVVSPFLFTILKKHFMLLVNIATLATGIGCVGRYFASTDYNWALFFTILVSVAHVPMITAPYGLLSMFPERHQSYASSIPLFIPILGINICIIYGILYITEKPVNALSTYADDIERLNAIIAVIGLVSCFLTFYCMQKLRPEIEEANKPTAQELGDDQGSFFSSVAKEFKKSKLFFIPLFAWGIILGLNWTYGGMFDVIFIKAGMNNTERAVIGLFANVSSALFSNLGTWISNKMNFSNYSIIFALNIAGLAGCLCVQASATIDSPLFLQSQWFLILSVIVLRSGFSSFVSLAFLELNKHGMAPVMVSSLFFYIANGSNLYGNIVADKLDNSVSLANFTFVVWICMMLVHYAEGKKQQKPHHQMELSSFDREEDNSLNQTTTTLESQEVLDEETQISVKN